MGYEALGKKPCKGPEEEPEPKTDRGRSQKNWEALVEDRGNSLKCQESVA